MHGHAATISTCSAPMTPGGQRPRSIRPAERHVWIGLIADREGPSRRPQLLRRALISSRTERAGNSGAYPRFRILPSRRTPALGTQRIQLRHSTGTPKRSEYEISVLLFDRGPGVVLTAL
jgi:hypothetical protein